MATSTTKSQNGKVSGGDAKAELKGLIELQPLDIQRVEIPVVGTSELITHAWSQKAKGMMLEKQMNPGTRAKKEPKDPNADYQAAFYRMPDGQAGVKASAFKAAIVGACRLFDGLPMTQAKIAIRVLGEILPLEGEPYMREDMVRLETGVADIRFRPGFPEWRCVLPISFNASLLTIQSLVNLVDAAGQGGICEWRPSSPKSASGSYGTFCVDRERLES